MNELFALPQLAERLAALASVDIETAEKFVRAFFAQIENALTVSESVTVRGLGTFSRNADSDRPIIFVPDSDLSAAINRPFAIFEPVELTSDADTAVLDTRHDVIPAPELLPEEKPETLQEEVSVQEPETISETEPETIPEPEAQTETAEIQPVETSDAPEVPAAELPAEPETETVTEPTDTGRRGRTMRFLLPVACLAAGIVIGWFAAHNGRGQYAAIPSETAAVATDTIAEIVSRPPVAEVILPETDTVVAAEPDSVVVNVAKVYDVVSANRFLTTMAREYYGQMEYWAFIYQANADILGHPNRIKPGTKVRIPDISEFATDSTAQQTLRRAKSLGNEIYARFE
ncbi:MAG: HU family DNA-binding protein [Muribaculaceae bacterium]|nr:HU family DNA-binding protein [Muribaculaceae bacterium]